MALRTVTLAGMTAQALWSLEDELKAATAMRDNAIAQAAHYGRIVTALEARKAASIYPAVKTEAAVTAAEVWELEDKVLGTIRVGTPTDLHPVAAVAEEPLEEPIEP